MVFIFTHIFDRFLSLCVLVDCSPALSRVIWTLGDWDGDLVISSDCSEIIGIEFAADVQHLQSDDYVDMFFLVEAVTVLVPVRT